MPEITFDEHRATRYDTDSTTMFDPHVLGPTVEFLAHHARGGEALELGIGTGRVAVPLNQRGVPVHGIELSPAMAAQMQAKEGTGDIGVTIGDFATASVGRTFRMAYLVYNTISNLTTQAEQVACFRNVATHLEPGGRFVIELFVPALQRIPMGETAVAFTVTPTRLGFDQYDVVNQICVSNHYWVGDGEADVFSAPYRYVWPSELDLMAQLADMTLLERWGGWSGEPFTKDSRSHVSVWEKPE